MKYSSEAETLRHIKRVNELMLQVCQLLLERAKVHDNSKLESPEKELFDEMTPLLKNLEFGSEAYQDSLRRLAPALEHHYKNNSHHPQHYQNGIDGMDLLDIVEMFLDWKAAGERNKNGSILQSIEINKDRFSISPQLESIFINTAETFNFK